MATVSPAPTPAQPWLLIYLLCLVQAGTALDNAALVVSLGAIATGLHATIGQLNVANVIYPLAAGATMLVFGAIGLVTGWKRLLQLGLVLLIAGEVTAVLSPNILVFSYLARLLTGIGAGAAVPAVLALMTVLFAGELRAKAFGALGAATGIAAIVAPLLSGLLIEVVGWRWVFVVLSLPFAVALVGTRMIEEPATVRPARDFDYVGATLSAAAIMLVLFGLMNLSTWGVFKAIDAPFTLFGYSPAPAIIVVGLILVERALHYERKREAEGKPVVLPSAFLKPEVLSALALAGFYFGLNGALGFMVIIYMQVFVGLSAMTSGLILAGFALATVLGSALVPGYFRQQRDLKRFVAVMMGASLVLQLIMLVAMNGDYHLLWLVGLVPLGFVLGTTLGIAPTVVTAVVRPELSAQSAGIQGSARNVAQAVGTAVAGVTLTYAMTIIARSQAASAAGLSDQVKDAIRALPTVPVVSRAQLNEAALAMGLPPSEIDQILAINAAAEKDALTGVMIAIILFTSLFWLTFARLPRRLQTSEPKGDGPSDHPKAQ